MKLCYPSQCSLLMACFASFAIGLRGEELTLEAATQFALAGHSEIRRAEAEFEAAQARALRAGALPNPEAVARVEGAPLGGGRSSAEFIAGASQAVPVGGRLAAAREVEKRQVEMSRAALEGTRARIKRRVHSAFATLLYAQESARLQSELRQTAEDALRLNQKKLELGEASSADLLRFESEALQLRLAEKRAANLRIQAALELAVAMGTNQPVTVPVKGALTNVFDLGAVELFKSELQHLLAEAEAESLRRKSSLELVRRERIPDVNLDLFYRRLSASPRDSFDAGVRVAIPVFSNSASKTREARAEIAAAEARAGSLRLAGKARLEQLEANLSSALEALRLLETEILPRARTALKTVQARYDAGDVSAFELLIERRALTNVTQDYLQTWREILELIAGASADM